MKKMLVTFALCLLILASVLSLSNCGGVLEFKVSFIVDGEVYSQIVTNGSEIIKMPDNPTKEGYTFDGWFWDEETWQKPFTANSLLDAPLSSDMNVYSKWIDNNKLCEHIDADDNGKCDRCEENFSDGEDVEVHVHSYTLQIVNNDYLALASDCVNAAKYFYSCSCGEKSTSTFTHGEPNGHTAKPTVVENKVEATCYTDGHYDSVVYCAKCNNELSRIRRSIQIEHIYLNGVCVLCGGDDPESFTVSFDVAGGSTVTSQLINKGECATLPLEPTKDGYTFAGWYSGETAWDFATPITADTALTAKWEKTVYTITYMDGATAITGLNPTSYVEGTGVLTLPIPQKLQHDFEGWYTTPTFDEGTKVTEIAATATGNVTLYAKFVENQLPPPVYNIVYKDGTAIISGLTPATYTAGEGVAVLPTPEKAHYRFDGWYTDASFANGTKLEAIAAHSVNDVTLYAKFTPVSYTITYSLGGGVNSDSNPTSYTVLDTATLANPTKDGCTFAGWYTDVYLNNQITSLEGQSGNLVLYAKWIQIEGSGILTPEHTFGTGE